MESNPALDGDTSRDPREASAAPTVEGKRERAAGRTKQRWKKKKDGSPSLDLGTGGQGDAAAAVRTPKKGHAQVRSTQHASGCAKAVSGCAKAISGDAARPRAKEEKWLRRRAAASRMSFVMEMEQSCDSETHVVKLGDTSNPREASVAPYVVEGKNKETTSSMMKQRRRKKKNRSPSPDLVTDGQSCDAVAVRTPKKQHSQTRSPPLACDASGCAQAASGEACAAPALEKRSNLQLLCPRAASGEASVMLHGLSKSEKNLTQNGMGQSSCDTETSVATDKISEFAAQVELQDDLNQAVLPTCLDSGRSEEAHRNSPVVTTSKPLLEKEPKIQSSLASTDPVGITSDHGERPDNIAHVFNDGEIEGLDWSDAQLREKVRSYMNMLNYSLPDKDDEFWSLCDDQELKKLNERLALYRIRAHKIAEGALLEELVDAKLIEEYPPAILEDEEYFEWYEKDFEWYFDPKCCRFVGFQDYQCLVLRKDTHYLRWDEYHKTYMTYQGDQEYVKFYETVSSETKWLENFVEASRHEWLRYETLAFYKALKIAAGCNNILPTLIYTGFNEYLWSVKCISVYEDFASLYLEIWKRVAKEKMSFLSAVKEIHDRDICAPCCLQLKVELGYAPRSAGLRTNYDKYLADLNGEVEQNEAHSIILEAVKKFVPKQKSYYDYVIKKLDIARKIGVIPV